MDKFQYTLYVILANYKYFIIVSYRTVIKKNDY